MVMANLDEERHRNQKILNLSLAAIGLDSLALTWCAAHLTDGFIPNEVAIELSRKAQRVIVELVNGGRWETHEGGYLIHDYLRYNKSREDVFAQRQRTASRVAKHRSVVRQAETVTVLQACNSVTSPDVTRYTDGCNALHDDVKQPPARASRKKPSQTIPKDFCITEDMREWAFTSNILIDIDAETQHFLDWARAKDARYASWVAAWRNWMRKAQSYQMTKMNKQQIVKSKQASLLEQIATEVDDDTW